MMSPFLSPLSLFLLSSAILPWCSCQSVSDTCSSQSCRPITCILVSVCLSQDGVYLPYHHQEEGSDLDQKEAVVAAEAEMEDVEEGVARFNLTGGDGVIRVGMVNVRMFENNFGRGWPVRAPFERWKAMTNDGGQLCYLP